MVWQPTLMESHKMLYAKMVPNVKHSTPLTTWNVLNVCDSLFRSRFKFLYYKSHSNLKGQGKSNMTLPLFDVRSQLSTDKVLNQL